LVDIKLLAIEVLNILMNMLLLMIYSQRSWINVNPNVALEYLYQQINSAISKHAPLICNRVKWDKLPEWFNDDIEKLLNFVIIFIKNQDFSKYRTQRNKVVNMIKRAKRTFCTNAIRNRTDSKTLWKHFLKNASYQASTSLYVPLVCRQRQSDISG